MAESLETILVVDDPDADLGTVISVLKCAKYYVIEAASATDAIELASTYQKRIDLLLADLKMQVMSRRNFVNEVRRSRPDVHMMFMSAISGGDLLVFNHDWTVIEKPLVPKKLLEIVTNVLHSPDNLPASNPYDKRTSGNTNGAAKHYRSYATGK
jgi:CheY-like chemotaxis protein